ncbi:MAG: Npt1/Npt2 family nucleotide transporter [Vicinamibacterales bacterium]|nr:Npt1/Npt2 family nucleotide transporter [Vicinamibacterales bacterium]
MLRLLERLLGLHASELRRALPLFAYLFLVIAGSVASRAARDALFLERFRAVDLPYADIVIAVLVGLVVSLYLRIGERTSLRNVQVASLLFFAATGAGFWWLSRPAGEEPDWLFAVIYVWVGVFSVIAPVQVWTLANYVMTTREAKRGFGFVGSGAILGWIVGGLVTRETAERFGTESMLLWVALSLGVCVGLVAWIWHERPDYVSDGAAIGGPQEGPGGIWATLLLLHRSPYLRAIAAVVCLSAFATTVAGWQFKAVAKEYIPEKDALAAFFGTFNVVAGLASLFLQVMLTGRVLKRAGVGLALFIVPVAIAAGSTTVLIFGTLLAVAALKASDQVLRYSIDKATVELLYLPVPSGQTFQVKAFIDTVIYRVGDALGGIAVLVFAAALGVSPIQMAWVVLALVAAWLMAAAVARRLYVENLQDSIHQHRVDAERVAAPVLERSTSELITRKLAGTPAEVLYALDLMTMAHDRSGHPEVRGLLAHDDPAIRRRAIAVLADTDDRTVQPEVERLIYDDDLEVRIEALHYLSMHARIDPLERIEQLGDFPDFSIRAAMVSFLARPGSGQNVEAARLILAGMVAEAGEAGRPARFEAARLLGALPDLFDRELRQLLQDEDAGVARAAIASVGRLRKRLFVPRLLERLGEPALAEAGVDALAAFGDGIVGTLRDALVDRTTPIEVRREIPNALLAIGTRAAQYVLVESVLDSDTVLRYRVIFALNKLGQLYPDRRIDRKIVETVLAAELLGHYRTYQVLATLVAPFRGIDPLVQGVHESKDQEAERIFRLLKILHPEHDLHSAYVGLRSSDPVVHDNAIEFLENILSPQVRSVVLPLFDRGVTPAERAAIGARMLGTSMGEREEAISVLTLSNEPWLQSCAAFAIGELRLMRFADVLDRWAADPDPLLSATAEEARQKLKASASATAGAGLL